jgi:hypothetical protein
MISVLYPEDRKAPAEVDIAKEDIRAIAKNIIRAAVPKGGAPKTAGELIKLVRTKASGCYVLWPEEVIVLIEEVAAERPVSSQLSSIPKVVEPIEEGKELVAPVGK